MGKCERCGSTKNVINHHVSYEPLILVPLCGRCHAKVIHPAKIRVSKEVFEAIKIAYPIIIDQNNNVIDDPRPWLLSIFEVGAVKGAQQK